MKIKWEENLCNFINGNKWCYYEKIKENIRLYFREDATITEILIKKIKKEAKKHGYEFGYIAFCPIEQTPYIYLIVRE